MLSFYKFTYAYERGRQSNITQQVLMCINVFVRIYVLQNIWIWCESEDIEMEQLSPNIPLAYFPYRKQEGYLAPFVVVRLLDLPGENPKNIKLTFFTQCLFSYKYDIRSTKYIYLSLSLPSPAADQKVKVVCRVWASNVQHKLNLRRTGESVTYFHVN